MIIAVDFDGTIVEHEYPKIGKKKPFVFETLKALQKDGHLLILWTIRTGPLLEEAIEFCRKNGIEFYAANKNYPEEVYDESISRKVNAELFIDDRNVGGFIPWGEMYQMIQKIAPSKDNADYWKKLEKVQRKGFLVRLFNR